MQRLACPFPRRMSLFLGILAVLALFTACEKPVAKHESAVPVEIAVVKTADVPLTRHTIGTAESVQSVTIRAQVSGILQDVAVKEGQPVKAGQRLFGLDIRSYAAAHEQAQAALEQTRIQARHARVEATRLEGLFQKRLASESEYDTQRSAADALEASVRVQEAQLKSAALNVRYGTLTAPLSGRLGTLLVHKGDLVKADDTALVTLAQMSPIRVKFSLPEKDLGAVRRAWSAGEVRVSVRPNGTDGETSEGSLVFVDNAVDAATGSILLKAEFANDDERLWPGQYADVTLILGTEKAALTVPSEAVQTGQKGAYVFVADAQGNAHVRTVETGGEQDGVTLIRRGLQAGEQVVTDGQIRLREGTRVTVRSPVEASSEGRRP